MVNKLKNTILLLFITGASEAQKTQANNIADSVKKDTITIAAKSASLPINNSMPNRIPNTTQAKAAGVEQLVVNSCKSNTREHNRTSVTTNPINSNGNSTITIAEKGDYTFFVTPKDGAGKKVNPIRTVLCKNPPCPRANLMVATPNANGEVEYKNLEPGTYQLTIELAETVTNSISTKDLRQKN